MTDVQDSDSDTIAAHDDDIESSSDDSHEDDYVIASPDPLTAGSQIGVGSARNTAALKVTRSGRPYGIAETTTSAMTIQTVCDREVKDGISPR